MRKKFKRKERTTDFTEAMLPHNRRQVFFDVVKDRWTSFVGYGLLVLVFAMPMLLFMWIGDSYKYGMTQNVESMTEEEKQVIYNKILSMNNTGALLDILSFTILSVCIAGLVRVIRQHAFGEHVSFWSDVFAGIKQNIRQMAPLGIIVGAVNALSVIAYNFSSAVTEGAVALLMMISVCFAVLIGIPITAYSAVCISIYNGSLLNNIKIGLTVFAKAPLKTYIALLLCAIPFIPQFIPNMYFHLFGGMIGYILSPFAFLAWYLFALNMLDEYINKEHFPELVGKGTFPESHSAQLDTEEE